MYRKDYEMAIDTTDGMAFLAEEEDEALFMQEMEQEMNVEHKKAVARELRKGQLRIFRMPQDANNRGVRVANIRFLVRLGKGTSIIEHGKFGSFRTACPAEFGFDCQWCDKICKKNKITRPQMLAELSKYNATMRREVEGKNKAGMTVKKWEQEFSTDSYKL